YKVKLHSKGVKREIAKLLLNTLYGRFGMRETPEVIEIVKPSEYESMLSKYEVKNLFTLSSGNMLVRRSAKSDPMVLTAFSDEAPYTPIKDQGGDSDLNVSLVIAAAITAYSRIHMNHFKALPGYEPYYTDTDSIVYDKPLPATYVGRGLGKMKLEYG